MSEVVKQSIVAKKSYEFGLKIIRMTRTLDRTYENIVLIKQIIRSATSIGANIEEALGANSRKEFIHSMNIAKKEARETMYWLKLIAETNKDLAKELVFFMEDNLQLINILTKIVKTSNSRHA